MLISGISATQSTVECVNNGLRIHGTVESEEVIQLNSIQREGSLRITNNKTTIRDIRVQLIEIQLHCFKETIVFTQDVEVKAHTPRVQRIEGTMTLRVP
ncbi:hypothetical protein GCK72_025967 [Caenorhabditis remanei]|uniref:Phlebovirus glycoprotein G2 fusion domain-containing protein n=1 Tax=Caenorhabditis remanei TaxID=31234 RepID=A0A6A5G4T7_CAERE|nr:hypothetical protein GCK72_025967 [Caenorhabditis remanei]KAF1749499.1 hypothetical protein GCK72_025967 [Caenorhabditis remanei]